MNTTTMANESGDGSEWEPETPFEWSSYVAVFLVLVILALLVIVFCLLCALARKLRRLELKLQPANGSIEEAQCDQQIEGTLDKPPVPTVGGPTEGYSYVQHESVQPCNRENYSEVLPVVKEPSHSVPTPKQDSRPTLELATHPSVSEGCPNPPSSSMPARSTEEHVYNRLQHKGVPEFARKNRRHLSTSSHRYSCPIEPPKTDSDRTKVTRKSTELRSVQSMDEIAEQGLNTLQTQEQKKPDDDNPSPLYSTVSKDHTPPPVPPQSDNSAVLVPDDKSTGDHEKQLYMPQVMNRLYDTPQEPEPQQLNADLSHDEEEPAQEMYANVEIVKSVMMESNPPEAPSDVETELNSLLFDIYDTIK